MANNNVDKFLRQLPSHVFSKTQMQQEFEIQKRLSLAVRKTVQDLYGYSRPPTGEWQLMRKAVDRLNDKLLNKNDDLHVDHSEIRTYVEDKANRPKLEKWYGRDFIKNLLAELK